MEIPENTTIIQYITKYFMEAGRTGTPLTNENVRVIYGETHAQDTPAPNVKLKELNIDIFVKYEEQYNYGEDRLLSRDRLIANRILYLLTNQRYNGGYRFWPKDKGPKVSRTVGYARFQLVLNYMDLS